ncbi:MAG TPA: hypothetical protein VMU48_04460 [Terracidiphilus sp.]|nr:hypothetical protein [Terracidiphilus sp.]
MTLDEHRLIIEMFKHQTVIYAGLVEALKSRGVLEQGDLQAFDALVTFSSREVVEQNIEELYRSTAAILGVTGLPSS